MPGLPEAGEIRRIAVFAVILQGGMVEAAS